MQYAAPNNIGTNNGYYVIYVVAGIYNVYVFIGKSKQNLMIVGDGINRTVITGNRSVVDGWTTFQSATFGKVIKGMLTFIWSYSSMSHIICPVMHINFSTNMISCILIWASKYV